MSEIEAKYNLFKQTYPEEHTLLCIMGNLKIDSSNSSDDLTPSVDWFMENGNCYVYWDGFVIETFPGTYHYKVPISLKEKAVKILTDKGFHVGNCCNSSSNKSEIDYKKLAKEAYDTAINRLLNIPVS